MLYKKSLIYEYMSCNKSFVWVCVCVLHFNRKNSVVSVYCVFCL